MGGIEEDGRRRRHSLTVGEDYRAEGDCIAVAGDADGWMDTRRDYRAKEIGFVLFADNYYRTDRS
jgi:hypothetical protein